MPRNEEAQELYRLMMLPANLEKFNKSANRDRVPGGVEEAGVLFAFHQLFHMGYSLDRIKAEFRGINESGDELTDAEFIEMVKQACYIYDIDYLELKS